MGPTAETERVARAREAVAANPHWYHTLELAPGVLTPGNVDLRSTAKRVLPENLAGRRTLDVGTFDGFWAFEMERRGAESLAIDVARLDAAEWPPINRPELTRRMHEWDIRLGRGFRLASDVLGSKVRRVECDVYDLTPEIIGGPVDVIFLGAILLHLRDPVRALERALGALKPGGELLMLETFSVRDTILSPRRPVAHCEPLITQFNWWHANLSCLKAWPWAAGFIDVKHTGIHRPAAKKPMGGLYASLKARRPESATEHRAVARVP
jgi:SAM-dependent methyltransferase